MHKFVALADAPVRERLHARCTHHLLPAHQPCAQVFKRILIEIRGHSADSGGEHHPSDARPLQHPLLFGAQARGLGVDHLAYTLRHPERDVLERYPELPAIGLPGKEALPGQMVEHGPHEQGIALRAAEDQPGQALRQGGTGGHGGEIGGDVGGAERLDRELVTQLMHPQVLRERLQGMVPHGQVSRTGGGHQQQLGGRPATRQSREHIHRGGVHPLEILQDHQERPLRRERLQQFRYLTQHALARGALELALLRLAVGTGHQGWKLHQPGRRVRGQRLDVRSAVSPLA